MKKASDLRIPFVWADRRPVHLERFFYVPEHFDRHEDGVAVPWEDDRIFGNSRPVVIEYCSGNGQWICEKAKNDPSRNWVAIDLRFDRSRKTWARMQREKIANLYVICAEARIATRHYLPKNSVSELFINFPDPWPKLRHAKHRLIQKDFLLQVAEICLLGCKATFVTDDEPYARQMLLELDSSRVWQPRLPEPHYSLDDPHYGGSYFSDLWKSKGRKIYFLPFELN